MSTSDVAAMAGQTERAVQMAAQRGALSAHREVGRTHLFDDLAATAWTRGQGKGRVMSIRMRKAVFALLDERSSSGLSAAETTRLRHRLAGMTAQKFSHAIGGLGGPMARYRRAGRGPLVNVTPVALVEPGIVGKSRRRVLQVDNLDEFEARNPVALDADGDIIAIERDDPLTLIRRLVDTYLLGDSRVSHAAAVELTRRLDHVAG